MQKELGRAHVYFVRSIFYSGSPGKARWPWINNLHFSTCCYCRGWEPRERQGQRVQRTAHKSAPVAKQSGVRGEQQDPAIDRKLRSRAAVPERCMASASLQELLWQSGQVSIRDQCLQTSPLLHTGSSCCHWKEPNPEGLKRRCTPWVTSNICEAEPVSLAGQNQQWLQSLDKRSSSRISLTVHHSLHLQGSSAGTAEAFLSK